MLEMFDDVLTRDNEIVHISSSALVVNKNRVKALMVHHNIFNSYGLGRKVMQTEAKIYCMLK
jgi:hypothetical protein